MHVDVKGTSKPLVHHWSVCVGAGRANEGLRANWLEQLAMSVKECGFKYLRFHGLFHDDMFVYRVRDGKEVFNWQYIDELLDRMLDIGIRPFVELGFCPGDLASIPETFFWWNAHCNPPKDYAKWAELVERFIRHCIGRYGMDEVRQWYFEVWNEADLECFWKGTKEQYFELYSLTARTVKKVDPQLRVGGPAFANFVTKDYKELGKDTHNLGRPEYFPQKSLDAFLDYCKADSPPLDFVSVHIYPCTFAIDDTSGNTRGYARLAESVVHDLDHLRQIMSASKYPSAEFHMTEWNSSPCWRDFAHDYPQSATFIVRSNIEASGMTDSLSYWAFTDIFEELGAGDTIFHGGFGLINFQGIVKPSFHAYRFLNALGDQELARQPGWIVTRRSSTGKVAALAYHYPPEDHHTPQVSYTIDEAEKTLHQGKPATMELQLCGLPAGASFAVETLDEDHGFAFRAWQAMGCPEPPNRQQTQVLRQAAWATDKHIVCTDVKGVLKLSLQMKPWAVALIREL